MNTNNYKTAVVFIFVLLIITTLFVNSGLVGADRYRLLLDRTHLFNDVNERLDYEVLKLRTGVLRHYNTLDQGLTRLHQIIAEIKKQSEVHNNIELSRLVDELIKELILKEDAINHLKSDNGVLRNSLMYFSVLSEDIQKKSQKLNSGHEVKKFVLEELPVLSGRVIQIVRNPRQSVLLKASSYINDIKKEVGAFKSHYLKNKILLILSHASVIVEHTVEVNSAIVSIIESGVSEKLNTIENIVADDIEHDNQQKGFYRMGLFVVALLLTLYAAYAVYRLRMASQELKSNLLEMRYQKLAVDKHAVICVVDDNEIIREVNENYLQVFECDQQDVLNKRYQDVHELVNEQNEDIIARSSAGKLWKGIVKENSCKGKELWFELTVFPFINEQKKVYKKIYIGTNITDKKEAESHIEYQIFHDHLTGLPNRRLLLERIEQALEHCKIHKHYGSLIYIDIDRFKRVNESLGHSAGDFILIEIASRLTKVSTEATIARLGADEFVVLMPEIADDLDYGHFVVQRSVSKIQTVLSEKYEWQGTDLHASPSFGITLFPIEETDPQEILKQADTALHRAKEVGKGQYRFFHPRMQQAVEDRLKLENDLRKSFEANQLHLNIQPQYNVNGTIIGAEVLIRWRHPERGMVSPAEFIPMAEETGLIIPVGRWVIEQACILIRHWQEQFKDTIPFDHIAVNVSALQFMQDSFVDMVREIIQSTEANPKYLELEITEGMLISDVDETIAKISQLKEMGIRFSVDDFGTGYSSLMYLSRLPIEQLKIDRGFVKNIEKDKYNSAIVETIISMAKHLNMDVIAEGVETEDELKCLKEMGCYNFQGYFYSRPLEVNTFNDLLNGVYLSKHKSIG